MHIEEQLTGDVAVISLSGDFWQDDDNTLLQDKITSLKLDGIQKIVFDLGNVNRVNSRGLSALIAATTNMRHAGGDIRFARIDRQIGDIFVKTRLVQVFSTYETVERAVASYYNNSLVA
jgi:anti-sigma B factor antagonist